MATPFIRFIATVVVEIADELSRNAIIISTGVFRVRIARLGYLSAECDVIFIRAVFTVVVTVTNLPRENTASIVALETITTDALVAAVALFIGIVATIINTVTPIFFVDANVISALEPVGWTESPIWESWRAIEFVRGVDVTIAFAITAEVTRNAVAAVALERAVLTGKTFTVQLVRAVDAVGVVVAAVAARDAFTVAAAELGSGTVAVLMVAQLVTFVITIRTVVLKVARPAARDAALILALELGRFMALGAVLRQLVRSITTIVLPVAEEPLRNAAIVAPFGTTSPSGGTIPLAADVCRFVRSITAVIVGIAIPRLLNAASVLAGKLGFGVARPRVANGWIFVTSVTAVVVTIALPRTQNAPTRRIAFELVLRAGNVAILFIRAISAVVGAITQRRRCRAVVVHALELTRFTEALLARAWLIRSVTTILFSVTLPVQRNAPVVISTTSVLTCCAICDAGTSIGRHIELIWTGAFVTN